MVETHRLQTKQSSFVAKRLVIPASEPESSCAAGRKKPGLNENETFYIKFHTSKYVLTTLQIKVN